MKRLVAAALILVPCIASQLDAQAAVLEPGVRVRLHTELRRPERGTLTFVHADSLVVHLDAHGLRSLRPPQVHGVEISTGRSRGRGAAKGAVLGLAAGALSGVLAGAMSSGGSEGETYDTIVGGIFLGGIGLVSGTMIGACHGIERWTPVAWP